MKPKNLRGEEGQAAVLITLLVMFAFIALTALAIDGGHLYVVRRDLQNMGDAACLAAATELSLGGDTEGAIAKAQEYVIRNGGAEEFYTEQEGTGVGLVKGIEVSGANVRVALQEDVDTYFTMIFNRSSALVGARSRCNSQIGGGLLPIAVRRYDGFGKDPSLLDLLANKNCQPPGCYYDEDSDTVYLDGYYGRTPFHPISDTLHVPTPGERDDETTGNIDCDPDPPQGDDILDGVCVLGVETDTNDGTEKFSGFVSLDIRNIADPLHRHIEYYNGATGQDATNKALSSRWFCERGWRGRRVPTLGDQLAYLPGVSAAMTGQDMLNCDPPWEVGQQFVAVVYSGYVWDVPEAKMEIHPWVNPVPPIFPSITDTVTYTLTLEKVGLWPPYANFELQWDFMEGADEINPNVEFSENPVEMAENRLVASVDMIVYAENPITDTSYLSALTVRARDTSLGLTRWASTNFVYGEIGPDFTLYAHGREFSVPQGGVLRITVTARGFAGFSTPNADLSASQVMPVPPPAVFSQTGGPSKVKIEDGVDNEEKVNLKFNADASPGTYELLLTATAKDGVEHSVPILVNVYEPTGEEPHQFVIVEGFAPFEISYIDNNDVVAYAIGPIVPDLSLITAGTRGSLLPWAP